GLFAMARADTANAIALAAGDDSAEMGVIEGCSLLRDGVERVLLLVADCPLPEVYAAFQDTNPVALGWACVLTTDGDRRFALEWSDGAGDMRAERQESGASEAARFLISGEGE